MKSWAPIIVFFLSVVIGLLFFGKAHAEDLPPITADLAREYGMERYLKAEALAPPQVLAGPIGHPCGYRLDLGERSFWADWDGYQLSVQEITPVWIRFKLWFKGEK